MLLVFLLPLASATTFYCNFTTKSWARLNKVYTCEAQITEADGELQNVTGTHAKGKSNSSVRLLSVNQTVSRIPRNIGNFFPKLKGIEFWRSELVSISADDLKGLKDLENFGVSGNKLMTIDGDLFRYTDKLEWIDFSDNLIRQVGSDLLTNMKKLKEVNFINNQCISIHAKSSKEIKELREKLPLQCPITDSDSTETECSADCLARIDKELRRVDATIVALTNEIEVLRSKVDELSEINRNNEERFSAIERKLRELAANPGT